MPRFRAVSPVETHFVAATCEEMNCPAYLNGWDTVVPIGGVQESYIRYESRRRFQELFDSPGMVRFRFYPGQMCFDASKHKRRLERDPFFLKDKRVMRGPDWMYSLREVTDVSNLTEV